MRNFDNYYQPPPNHSLALHNPNHGLTISRSYYILSNTWITVTLRGQREERLLTVWSDREQMNIYITLCSVDDCILVGGCSQCEDKIFLILYKIYNKNNYRPIPNLLLLEAGNYGRSRPISRFETF